MTRGGALGRPPDWKVSFPSSAVHRLSGETSLFCPLRPIDQSAVYAWRGKPPEFYTHRSEMDTANSITHLHVQRPIPAPRLRILSCSCLCASGADFQCHLEYCSRLESKLSTACCILLVQCGSASICLGSLFNIFGYFWCADLLVYSCKCADCLFGSTLQDREHKTSSCAFGLPYWRMLVISL
jgi:hypothetical protein